MKTSDLMYLLDTHVVLWLVTDDRRFGASARHRLASSAAVHVSAVTDVELAIKSLLGRLIVPDELHRRMAEQGLVTLALTADHAAVLSDFPELVRHDPFDRILLGQAKFGGLKFLTADRRLLALGHDWIIDATQ